MDFTWKASVSTNNKARRLQTCAAGAVACNAAGADVCARELSVSSVDLCGKETGLFVNKNRMCALVVNSTKSRIKSQLSCPGTWKQGVNYSFEVSGNGTKRETGPN